MPAAPSCPDVSTLDQARAELASEWRSFAPESPTDITTFYQEAGGIKADLDAWHALPDRQRWTEMVVHVAHKIGARSVLDIGCGAGHDLLALREAGLPICVGVEPNHALRRQLAERGIQVVEDVATVPVDTADLLLCLDVLEHVPDPESFLAGIAGRAHLNAVLVETVATHDLGTPLHLAANRGWHPGRALEGQGWRMIDQQGRLRVWQRMTLEPKPAATLVLMSYRAVSVPTLESTLRLAGRGWRVVTKSGDALISRARSQAISRWWAETADDVCLMVDDDIVFAPEDAERLVQLCRDEHDLICAAYPVRNGQHLALRSKPGGIAFKPDADPLEIEYAATGFLAVHRRVVDRLVASAPLVHPDQPWCFWPLFAPIIAERNGLPEYLSEDWAFCLRARDAGFKVWLDPSIRLGHLAQIELNVTNMHALHAAISEAS